MYSMEYHMDLYTVLFFILKHQQLVQNINDIHRQYNDYLYNFYLAGTKLTLSNLLRVDLSS